MFNCDVKKKLKENKTFLINILISLIILLIILFAFYPGIVTIDGEYQWSEVQNGIITNSHPFFSTYFMYLLSKIHNSVTIVILYQIILISIVWGYLCKSIICSKKQEYIKYCYTILICLFPLIAIYSITLWKDIIYTIYLFCIGIMMFNWSRCNYVFSKLQYVILGVLCTLVFTYRHNGIIVSIMILLLILALSINKYNKRIINKSNLRIVFIIFISFIISLITILIPKNIILNNSQKKNKSVSISTIDSYMLWMFGAHITDDNITDKNDLDFLNNIIPIDEWKKSYSPYLVNNTTLSRNLNIKYIVDNEQKFQNLFIKYSIKYPNTIIRHYLKSDGLLINPVSMMKGYVYVYSFRELKYLPEYAQLRSKIPILKNNYIKVVNLTLNKPFIIFYQPAFILYVTIILTIILSIKVYGKKIWLFIAPMLFNTVSLLPINLAQDLRYVYINYLTFFGILLMFIINYKKIFTSKKKNLKKA